MSAIRNRDTAAGDDEPDPHRADALVRADKLNADRHLTWLPMSDFRHKLRNARPIVATNRETKTFAVKYA